MSEDQQLMDAGSEAPTRGWGSVVRDRRVIALGFVVLLVIPAFLALSRWQFHRLDERRAANAIVIDHSGVAPVPVSEVMTAGADASSVGDAQLWRPVLVTGQYVDQGTVLVRKRPLNGSNGFQVVTPLQTPSGSVLAIDRGWVAAGIDAKSSPVVPPAPTGQVTVTGRVRISQSAPPRPSDLPTGQVSDLDVGVITAGWGTAYPGYIDLVASAPAEAGTPALIPLPLPDIDEGPHLSYAMQWVAFCFVAAGGFIVLIRGEARRRIEDELDLVSGP